MSDPFYDAEASADASRPVELYTIVNGNKSYFHTSGERDVLWGGQLYTATACDRSEVGVNIPKATFELTLRLPCTHELAVRWTACAGTPPRKVVATVTRLQIDANVAEQIWQGEITAMTIKKGVANFNIPSRFGRRLLRRLGTISNDSLCPHTLYDKKCTVSDTAFTVFTGVMSSSGRRILVDMTSFSKADGSDWSVFGDLTHVPSGESMLILQQDDVDPGVSTLSHLTLQGQIYELKVGDQVKIRAGCAHDIATCVTKYSNQANFGGFPGRPLKNPSVPTGFGVVQQA